MNRSYDEYNYTLSKRELEELKFLFISDDVDYNDTDSNGLTFLLTKSLYNMLSNVKRRYPAVKAKPAICQKFFCFSVKAALTARVLTSLLTEDSPLV